MIPDSKLTKRAEEYVKGHKPEDVHPDVASRMAMFTREQDRGGSAAAVQAHAKSLLELAALLDEDDDTEQIVRRAPAKKAATKKAAAKKAPARRKA